MLKFDNAKVGDRVFDLLKGWGTIGAIRKNEEYPIYVNADIDSFCTFTLDGKRYVKDLTPTLFWNEVKLPNDEEDKKPFDLVEFLRENLEPRDFRGGTNNIELRFSHKSNKWKWNWSVLNQSIGAVYFRDRNNGILHYIIDILNKNKITPQQLRNAYRELGWL